MIVRRDYSANDLMAKRVANALRSVSATSHGVFFRKTLLS